MKTNLNIPNVHTAKSLKEQTDKLESIKDNELERLSHTLVWGTYGRELNQPLQHKPVASLTPDHIENILVNLSTPSPLMKKVMIYVWKKKLAHVDTHYTIASNSTVKVEFKKKREKPKSNPEGIRKGDWVSKRNCEYSRNTDAWKVHSVRNGNVKLIYRGAVYSATFKVSELYKNKLGVKIS